MGIIVWIAIGLVVGVALKFVYPGPHPGGVIGNVLAGIAGGFFGGWIGNAFTGATVTAITWVGVLWAVIGAAVLVLAWSLFSRRQAAPRVPQS